MMKRPCSKMFEALVDLAEGRVHPEAAAHVTKCKACSDTLAELTRGLSHLKTGFYDAPVAVIESAKAIFPQCVRQTARLLGTTLAGAGARGAHATQAAYEFEGGTARVMYEPQPEGWSVMARVEGEGWSAFPVEMDAQGRIEFAVGELSEAQIRLVREGVEVVIDPPSEGSHVSE